VIKFDGDDIGCQVRYRGSWHETMELHMFPFDCQELTISLAINCRTTGMTPVRFVVAPDALLRVDPEGFSPAQGWQVNTQLFVTSALVGSSADRKFPTLKLTTNVTRRSGFILLQVILPIGFMAPVASLGFWLPKEPAIYARRLQLCVVMLLTTTAYKASTRNMCPDISYLTICDKYSMACIGCLLLLAASTAIVGQVSITQEQDVVDLLDRILFITFACLYAFLHLYMALRVRYASVLLRRIRRKMKGSICVDSTHHA